MQWIVKNPNEIFVDFLKYCIGIETIKILILITMFFFPASLTLIYLGYGIKLRIQFSILFFIYKENIKLEKTKFRHLFSILVLYLQRKY